MDKLTFQIASRKIKGVGDVTVRTLIAYLGDVEAMFAASNKALRQVPGIFNRADVIERGREAALQAAVLEAEFVRKYKIETYFCTDDNYPLRLRECVDAPLLMYSRGNFDLNANKVISIVGTRKCTPYGAEMTNKLLEGIAEYYPDVLVVSGLAYGVDIMAHRNALACGLPTLGVVAHGLDRIYPAVHKNMAKRMVQCGGLLTEYDHGSPLARENFVKRNRIVAGISDATIVIESAKRGGSLITASIAASYNREVFAVPGRVTDEFSKGCNLLIRTNRAAAVETLEDLEYILGWDRGSGNKPVQQTKLLLNLSADEQKVVDYLRKEGKSHINTLSIVNKLPMRQLNPLMINLEFNGVLRCYPGNMYELCD